MNKYNLMKYGGIIMALVSTVLAAIVATMDQQQMTHDIANEVIEKMNQQNNGGQ